MARRILDIYEITDQIFIEETCRTFDLCCVCTRLFDGNVQLFRHHFGNASVKRCSSAPLFPPPSSVASSPRLHVPGSAEPCGAMQELGYDYNCYKLHTTYKHSTQIQTNIHKDFVEIISNYLGLSIHSILGFLEMFQDVGLDMLRYGFSNGRLGLGVSWGFAFWDGRIEKTS